MISQGSQCWTLNSEPALICIHPTHTSRPPAHTHTLATRPHTHTSRPPTTHTHTHLRPRGCAPGLREVSVEGAPVDDTVMREVRSVLSTANTPDPPLQYKWRSSAAMDVGGSPGGGDEGFHYKVNSYTCMLREGRQGTVWTMSCKANRPVAHYSANK